MPARIAAALAAVERRAFTTSTIPVAIRASVVFAFPPSRELREPGRSRLVGSSRLSCGAASYSSSRLVRHHPVGVGHRGPPAAPAHPGDIHMWREQAKVRTIITSTRGTREKTLWCYRSSDTRPVPSMTAPLSTSAAVVPRNPCLPRFSFLR